MSSWLQYPIQRPKITTNVNYGFRQLLPQGKIEGKTKGVTVVSAFYTMKGKHSMEVYKERIRVFLEGCPCKMVFFTEEDLVPFIRECRRAYEDITDVLVFERSKWTANKNHKQIIWDALYVKDTVKGKYTTDYYKFLYEKREFVKRVIDYNPFGHTDFIWINPTICKDSRIIPLIKSFPVASRIPTDRLMLFNITPFEFSDEKIKTYSGTVIFGVRDKNRISSSIIAGTKEQWIHYYDMYEESVKKFQKANLFWGLDSILLASIALENKEKVSLIEPKPCVDPSWRSMYALLYLGVSNKKFELLTEKAKYETKMTCEEFIVA